MFFKKKFLQTMSALLILIFACSFSCAADSPTASLTVVLEDAAGEALDDISVSICQIAERNNADYYPTPAFESSGISISGIINHPSSDVAKDILKYMQTNEVDCQSAVSVNGQALFSGLDTGIWLVFCEPDQAYSFQPFIVFLPQVINNEACYDVTSAPKTDLVIPDTRSIYVVKQWDDTQDAAGKRPDVITVNVLQDGVIIDEAELTAANGWAYTFAELPEEGVYSVEEVGVEHYTATYNGDAENGFVITNSYTATDGKLPQTGQLWWPILLLTVGAAFIALGIVEVKGRKNGKTSA